MVTRISSYSCQMSKFEAENCVHLNLESMELCLRESIHVVYYIVYGPSVRIAGAMCNGIQDEESTQSEAIICVYLPSVNHLNKCRFIGRGDNLIFLMCIAGLHRALGSRHEFRIYSAPLTKANSMKYHLDWAKLIYVQGAPLFICLSDGPELVPTEAQIV